MEIYEKLKTIQQKLTAPKGQHNNYGDYDYRSCEDICKAVKPLLEEVGCVLTLSDDIVLVGERYYVKATATLISLEVDTKYGLEFPKVSNVAFAREPLEKKGSDASQITGACSSYARKVALAGLLLIDNEKDADVTNKHGKDEPEPKKEPKKEAPKTEVKKAEKTEEAPKKEKITKEQLQDLLKKCGVDNVPVEKVCRLYKIATLADMSPFQYKHANTNWEKVKAAE